MCVLLDTDGCVRKRPVVRGSVYNRKMQGLSKPATASNTYSDATYSNAYSDATASNTYPDTTYSNTHSGPNAVADSTEADSYAKTRSYSHSNRDSNGYTYGNSYSHIYSDCDSYADDHANCNTDTDSD